MSGPPILISPETAAGIKAGAKCGLSTLVCGILFGIATFFSPVFAAVPAAGTAPLLIMVGVMMFGNSKRIDWTDYKVAVPAYCVLFFIPFTYSILRGVAIGYVIYIVLGFYTGEMLENITFFIDSYRIWWTLLGTKKGSNNKKKIALTEQEKSNNNNNSSNDSDDGFEEDDADNYIYESELGNNNNKNKIDSNDTFDVKFKKTASNLIHSPFKTISSLLDSMEMQDGGVTKMEHM
jgi:hypothetical protein